MSRAERRAVPAAPRLGRVLRDAASDLYYNSWRFLGANLLIGALLVIVLLASVGALLALGLLVLVAVPAAGMMRMATVLVRDGHTDFGEFWAVVRRPWLVLGLAVVQLLALAILTLDVSIGVSLGGFLGSFLTVSAIYGLLVGWAVAVAMWPLILDPARHGDPVRRRIWLGALLLLAHPLRIGGVALLMGLLLVIAGLAVIPLVTIVPAYVWLVVARYVLPAADRLEGRETVELDEPG